MFSLRQLHYWCEVSFDPQGEMFTIKANANISGLLGKDSNVLLFIVNNI